MIEFKQIIGRGTRLYDGKDYFTIYDFVRAYEHFNDAAWDGEPAEPESSTEPSTLEPTGEFSALRSPPVGERREKVVVKLADGKVRQIQSMVSTSFWGADGKPVSAQQFLENLFGTLPELFKSESTLRELWSDPTTRSGLIKRLADKGFGMDQLTEMQHIIDADKSDIFDVLAYVGFALPTKTRLERAVLARVSITKAYSEKQQAFLDFVLAQYVSEGVGELDTEKLSPLLVLRYSALADAIDVLGDPATVRQMFTGFQRFLYESGNTSIDERQFA